jgi:hypothetical protein
MNSRLRRLALFSILTVGSAAPSGAQRMGFILDSLRAGDRVRFVSQDLFPPSERIGTVQSVSTDSLVVRQVPSRSIRNDWEPWTISHAGLVSLDRRRVREVSSTRTVIGAVLGIPLGFLAGWGACGVVHAIKSSACNISTNIGKFVLLGTGTGVALGAYTGSRPVDRWEAASLPRRR